MPQLTRRSFLRDLGGGSLAIAVFGLAACGSESGSTVAPAATTTTAAAAPPTASTSTSAATTTTSTTTASTTTGPESTSAPPSEPPDSVTAWERVDLGFVSAYVAVRGTEAAIVDTGPGGSDGAIGTVLMELGLGWADVGSVVLTHRHGDHVGSLGAVMDAASEAVGYAGAADIEAIVSSRELVAVGDGDTVLGLDVVETPGHTPGHISVHDSAAGVLVAGDALNGDDGGVAGANPQFSSDMGQANESAKKLAALTFDVAYFGHGEPALVGADAALRDLVAQL